MLRSKAHRNGVWEMKRLSEIQERLWEGLVTFVSFASVGLITCLCYLVDSFEKGQINWGKMIFGVVLFVIGTFYTINFGRCYIQVVAQVSNLELFPHPKNRNGVMDNA
jgi:hypothetical protein